jgi:hypothetical protein
MKALGYVLSAFIGAAIYVAITFALNPHKSPNPVVLVHIENRTGQDVREVRIEHEDGSLTHRGTWSKSISIPFLPSGDSSYRLFAILSDGTTAGGGSSRYVEPGAELHETLVATDRSSFETEANKLLEPTLETNAAQQ